MRTFGRITNQDGSLSWVEVQTDANGFDDWVWVTTLIQCLKLSVGESPFFSTFGIPAQRSVVQQVWPDYYVSRTQAQFSPRFANLVVAKRSGVTPTYNVNVTTHQGVKVAVSVPA